MVTDYETVRDALTGAIQVYRKDLNIYRYVPRTLVPQCAILKPRGSRTVDYMQAQGRSPMAKWYFTIMIIIGKIDERFAQKQAGELISPGSPLIKAIQDVRVGTGYAQVTEGSINDLMFGQALYTYAELQVMVMA